MIPELAALTLGMRVTPLVEVDTEEGIWTLARPSEELVDATMDHGCMLGNPDGTYPDEVICAIEYGEILLMDAGPGRH